MNTGIILFPLAIFALILSLIKGNIRNKIISTFLFISLPILIYIWMDKSMQLKSSEIFFVKRGEGKYTNFTEIEKKEEIQKLYEEEKYNKFFFNISEYLYGVIFITLIVTSVKSVTKQKTLVSSSHKRERSY